MKKILWRKELFVCFFFSHVLCEWDKNMLKLQHVLIYMLGKKFPMPKAEKHWRMLPGELCVSILKPYTNQVTQMLVRD